MPIGMTQNVTNVTLNNVTDLVNVTSFHEFAININGIYDGWLFFIILMVLWYILFKAANTVKDQPLNNAMYSGTAVTILSFILRAVQIIEAGTIKVLLTDHQMWLFPLLTTLLAGIIWATKKADV